MSDAPPPIKLTARDAELLASYSEGLLTEADARELNTRLHEAPELLMLIAHHAELEEHLRALLGEAHAADRGDWFLALAELEKGADQAELVDVETLMRGTTDSSDRPEPLTAHEALGALGYLAQQALRTRAGIISAAAAVVLLATAITLPLLVGEPSSNPSAQTTPPPRDQPRARPTAVATLTATDDAQWAAFNLSAGDTLYAGQRLTLTEGFAEVTTNKGAVALLEAPAVVELIDHDNTLHLHEGKLVGICETDASKGFVVHTPHMDVTDLGTEFGVNTHAQGVDTTVFIGEVAVKTPNASSQVIQHSQTARVSIGKGQPTLVVEDKLAQGFARRLPRNPLITDASTNLDGFKVEVVSQGVYEDAKLYTDRDHELNGIAPAGLPSFLLGGDLVRMPADARPGRTPEIGDKLQLTLELSAPSDIYLLIPEESETGDWLERDYENTGRFVYLDLFGDNRDGMIYEGGVGPGVSIDRRVQLWKYKRPVVGKATVARNIKKSMYSVIVLPHQPVTQQLNP